MTRLTLHWHLRNIIEGVPPCESKPIERDEFGVTKWERPPDYAGAGSGEYAKKNGVVNVFYDKTLASHALTSDDSVAYLDAVAHDPCVPFDWRIDAQELLSHHIMERRLRCLEETRKIMNEMRLKFVESELPKKSMQSNHWNIASCPNCLEKECLFNYDKPAEPNHCLNCGNKIPLPNYPE